jgi:hypothetical protein
VGSSCFSGVGFLLLGRGGELELQEVWREEIRG